MDDSERLDWLADQLWNYWTLVRARAGFKLWAPGEGTPIIEAPTLRETIDKAASWADEARP